MGFGGDDDPPMFKSRLRSRTKHSGDPRDTLIIITVAALSYIVALAWRDAAETAFDKYYPDDPFSVKARLIYAAIATIIVIIVIYLLARVF